jgi:predicted dithiol-disulfide oxidoreductase (DUF899 family)
VASSEAAWVESRKEMLAKEKEFTRLRDELSQLRRELPWRRVDKEYVFDGPEGKETLSQLFVGRSQLIVYHFMFDPDWDEGCKACSLCADHYEPAIVHLQQREVTMVSISRAPLENLSPIDMPNAHQPPYAGTNFSGSASKAFLASADTK